MESEDFAAQAPVDDLIKSDECTAADKENFFRVDLDIFLMRVFAPSLRRNVAAAAFQNLQKCLLNTFAGNVPGDADIVGLAPDLIDLVNIDDANLGTLNIVVRIL